MEGSVFVTKHAACFPWIPLSMFVFFKILYISPLTFNFHETATVRKRSVEALDNDLTGRISFENEEHDV